MTVYRSGVSNRDDWPCRVVNGRVVRIKPPRFLVDGVPSVFDGIPDEQRSAELAQMDDRAAYRRHYYQLRKARSKGAAQDL